MMKKEIIDVPYEVKRGVVCITPCPHYLGTKKPKVGSALCNNCLRFVENIKEKHIVRCNIVASANQKGHYKKKYTPIQKLDAGYTIYCETTDTYFTTFVEAAKSIGCSTTGVRLAVNENRPVKGYIFKIIR